MKRYILHFILLILCLTLLVGCSQSAEETTPEITEPTAYVLPADYTFPESTVVAGTDIGTMTVSEAYDAICKKINFYNLTVHVNDKYIFFDNEVLDLTCDKNALIAYATDLGSGSEVGTYQFLQYNAEKLESRVFNSVNTPAKNASIVFNAEDEVYELAAGCNGLAIDMDFVTDASDSAIRQLKQYVSVQKPLEDTLPEISENSALALAALEKANNYLTTEITYNFLVDTKVHSITISPAEIASVMGFDGELNPYIKRDALRTYVSELNKEYGMTGVEGAFKTTYGETTDLTVTYYAQSVDVNALYDEILNYLENNISVTKFAPRLDTLTPQETPYKGSYIEVDLSHQRLYLYQDNECILDTPIVTGCVSRYMNTPNGVYSILRRRMHVVLVGEDYETYVKYWMQFYGGYGLHDAYWRSYFGPNEYLYNGSHGCVNIPPDNAAFVYENVSEGYPVIVFGGATNKEKLQQEILGTDTYNISVNSKPFQLDTHPALGNSSLKYTTSDHTVASVSEDGTVTIHRAGTVYITAEYEESRYYTGASLRVTINANNPCSGDHTFGAWTTTVEPTCTTGLQSRVCEDCYHEDTRAIPAVSSHEFGDWEVTAKPGCKDGRETKQCSVCGCSMHRTLPAEHTMGRWRVDIEPTCVEPGEEHRTCRYCDYEERRPIDPTGHDFIDGRTLCQNGTCKEINPDFPPPTKPEEEE